MGRLGGSPSVRKAAVPGGQLGDLPLSDPVSRCPKVSDAHESNNVTRIPHQFLEDPERWIRYHSAETGAGCAQGADPAAAWRPPDRKSANWPRPKGLAWKGAVWVAVRSLRSAPFLGWQRDNRAAGV